VFLVISNRHPRRSNSSVASPFQFNRLRSIRVISGVNFYQDATAATANALCCILFLVSLAQVVETESACEALHKELSGLQRRRAELEEELRVKEKGYQLALDESRRSEKRLDDQRQRLEASLDNAGAELSETRLRLSAADGRITALEAQLARVEAGSRRDRGQADQHRVRPQTVHRIQRRRQVVFDQPVKGAKPESGQEQTGCSN
jgi:DNA repair exonuclease SbcCD ATPase subunit